MHMSIKIDEYISSTGAVSDLLNSQRAAGTGTEKSEQQNLDEYVPGASESSDSIPCENYNDILQVMRKADAQKNQEEASEQTAGGAGAGGTGGSDSEEETTTKMVTINGVTYLETTTVSDGVTTVIRSAIEGKGLTSEELLLKEKEFEQLEEPVEV